MNAIKESFFFVIAALFLALNGLWNILDAFIWRLVSLIPVKRIKSSLIDLMNSLPPYAALLTFLIPYFLILPIKLFALWLISEDRWLLGMSTFFLIKLIGLGFLAFLFDIGRKKFLSIGWFNWIYQHIIAFRDWCHTIVDPYKKQVHALWVFFSRTFYKSALWKRVLSTYKHWKNKIR
jgi:hypothetical protein